MRAFFRVFAIDRGTHIDTKICPGTAPFFRAKEQKLRFAPLSRSVFSCFSSFSEFPPIYPPIFRPFPDFSRHCRIPPGVRAKNHEILVFFQFAPTQAPLFRPFRSPEDRSGDTYTVFSLPRHAPPFFGPTRHNRTFSGPILDFRAKIDR